MVGARGFEPPTSASRTLRATWLRHAPMRPAATNRRENLGSIGHRIASRRFLLARQCTTTRLEPVDEGPAATLGHVTASPAPGSSRPRCSACPRCGRSSARAASRRSACRRSPRSSRSRPTRSPDEPLALGLLGLVEAIPALALMLFGGHIADRYDRRAIILVTGSLARRRRARARAAFARPRRRSGSSGILAVVFLIGVAAGFERPALTAFETQVIPHRAGDAWRLVDRQRLDGRSDPRTGASAGSRSPSSACPRPTLCWPPSSRSRSCA